MSTSSIITDMVYVVNDNSVTLEVGYPINLYPSLTRKLTGL